jgi:DNA mismatch repair ATPase MutS
MMDLPANQQKELETALGLIYDIARIHRSILRGTLHAADCLNLHQSYQSAIHLWSLVQDSPCCPRTKDAGPFSGSNQLT